MIPQTTSSSANTSNRSYCSAPEALRHGKLLEHNRSPTRAARGVATTHPWQPKSWRSIREEDGPAYGNRVLVGIVDSHFAFGGRHGTSWLHHRVS